jgi:PAS domain S-box-containing protein
MVHSHGVTSGGYPPGVTSGASTPADGSGTTAPLIHPQRRPESFPGLSAFGLTECALMMIDEDTVISGWSQGAEDLLGYRASEVTGHSATGLLAPERPSDPDAERLSPESRWRKRIGTQKPWTSMTAVRHRDGSLLRAGVEAVPLHGEDGAATWLVSMTAMAGPDNGPGVSASVIRTLLESSPVSLSVWDNDLTCVWLNRTAERGGGPHPNRRIGHHVHEALRGFDTDDVASVMRQVLEDGGPVLDHEFLWTSPGGGEERVYSSSLFRFDAEDGSPLGICAISVDITKSWARDRLALLSEAGRRIGTTLDTATTAQELAEVGCPLLADFVTVELDESVPLSDNAPERAPSGGIEGAVFRRLGVTSLRPGAPEAAYARGQEIYVPPSSPMYAVLRSGKSHFEPQLDASPEGWLSEDPVRARNVRAFGMHSVMVVPLTARGAVLGIAVFIRTVNQTPFSRDDLLLAEELAVRASLNLDNARRYTRERAAALALQRNLLPRRLSGGCALDVASRYLPTDSHEGVGGDWFDVIPLSGARIALVVGDVIGHGINAAASMGRLRTAVHTLADLDFAPDELLAHLDDLAGRLSEEQLGSDGFPTPVIGATCAYAVYDPVTRVCTVARAGHPPPALVDPDGRVTFPEIPAGAPIGYGLASYESAEFELPEGSLIAMYTDGLVETRHDDIDVGLDVLASALARPGTDLEQLCGDVVEATLSQSKFEDDAALLLARTHALGPDQVMSYDLPDEPMAIRTARSLAVRQLSEWGLGHLRRNVELIISELVTNAVRHARGPVRLRLIRHKSLVCEVYDADSRLPRLRHARVTEESGRGLLMVAELSHRWGCRFTPDGKVTWAEVEIPVRAGRSPDEMGDVDEVETPVAERSA